MTMMASFVAALLFLFLAFPHHADGFHVAKTTEKKKELTSLFASNNVSDDGTKSRRDLLVEGVLLTHCLLAGKPAFAATGESARTIVITGANSGVGFEACKLLAAAGHTLVLACRTADKARDAVQRIQQETTASSTATLIAAECDLAHQQSIQTFANELPNLLTGNNKKIDILCLNAGIARNTASKDCLRTADGFELTVGTNHFGHFYLNHLVQPMIEPSGGRIVVTASGVHDPESTGGAQGVPSTLGDMQGLELQGKECEMIDGGAFNADKAYKDSKLCNVLFTRELQRRLSANPKTADITANCFNPGLIVGTGLFRDQNPLFTKLFDFAATDLLKVGESPSWGGGCLAYMTNLSNNRGGLYYSSAPGSSKYGDAAYGKQFAVTAVSKEAQDDAKAKRLWELSSKLLGLSS